MEMPTSRRTYSHKERSSFSPHEPIRPTRVARGMRPRRLALLSGTSHETTAWPEATPPVPDSTSLPNVPTGGLVGDQETPSLIPYDSDTNSSTTEHSSTTESVERTALVAGAFETESYSAMPESTEHAGPTETPQSNANQSGPESANTLVNGATHEDLAGPSSATEAPDGSAFAQAKTIATMDNSREKVETIDNSGAQASLRDRKPETRFDLYVPPQRLTRQQYQALGGARSGALGVNARTLSPEFRSVTEAQLTANVETDAQLAAIIGTDSMEALGGDLSPSEEDNDSDFEVGRGVRSKTKQSVNLPKKRKPRRTRAKRTGGQQKPAATGTGVKRRRDSDDNESGDLGRTAKDAKRRSKCSDNDFESAEDNSAASVSPVREQESTLGMPAYLIELDGPLPAQDGSFAYGLQTEFDNWDDFADELTDFMTERYQLFKIRTSSNVVDRNAKLADVTKHLPERFVLYAQTWKCVHGMSRDLKASINSRRYNRYTGCSATINATVQRVRPATESDDGCAIRWNSKGGHNHKIHEDLFKYYPEIRLPKTSEMYADVDRIISCGGNATGICLTYRRETGLPSKVRDFQNVIAKVRREKVKGTTVEDRLDAHLRSFVSTPGNWATVYADEKTKDTTCVAYQSARMQRLFAAGPQVVMVDCTHGTNKSKFTLFSFVVHDLFGKGQYVFHALMKRETMDNMEDAIDSFLKANPKATEIRAFVVDKDFKERTLLRKFFPNARILLCQFHVIKVFAKKVKELVRGTKEEKAELITVLRAMIYARSRPEYEALKLLFAKKLARTMESDNESHDVELMDDEDALFDEEFGHSGEYDMSDEEDDAHFDDDDSTRELTVQAMRDAREDAEVRQGKLHRMFRYFTANWEPCEQEWLTFLRGHVAHLGNNTNNRIEAKWGAIKRILDARMDLEETIRSLRELQALNEDEYMDKLTKTGTRHSYTGDSELDQLINLLSDHAYDLVTPEYIAVKKGDVHYLVRETDGHAVLKSSADGDHVEHTVNVTNWHCSCLFSQVRLLPCRHVFFYRKYKAFPDVVPFKSINSRWSMKNPANDITKGDVSPSRYRVRNSRRTRDVKLSRGDKFCKVMAVLKPLAGMIAEMGTSSFTKWIHALEKIRDECGEGVVPSLERDADADGHSEEESTIVTEHLVGSNATVNQSEEASNAEDVHSGVTEMSDHEDVRVQFKISDAYNTRPARNRQHDAERKKLESQIQSEVAKFLGRESIPATGFSLADVEGTFGTQLYTFRDAIPLICGIPIERLDAVVRLRLPEHVVADCSAIRFVLTESVMRRALEDVEEHTGHADATDTHVAVVDNRQFLGVTQLRVMKRFHAVLDQVHEVATAIAWLRRVKTTNQKMPFPFDNVCDHMDKTFIDDAVSACETMPLGDVRTHVDLANGCKLLEMASNKWLSTTTVNALLAFISSSFSAVGVVKPEYFTAKAPDARERILSSTDPFGTGKNHMVGILNISNAHWMCFAYSANAKHCILYDPLPIGREARVEQLKDVVHNLLKENADDTEIKYSNHTDYITLDQDDSNSCGVFCAVFLELALSDAKMTEENSSKEVALPSCVHRARYMTMLGFVMRTLKDHEEKKARK